MTINKASPTSFKLSFPVIPETDNIAQQKQFSIFIIQTVLPSFTISPVTIPWRGTKLFAEGGDVNYDSGTTSFYIDENGESYLLMYDGMGSINNGVDVFGRQDYSYQINATLTLLDNYENPVLDFTFVNLWPSSLGEATLSYQDGEHFLSSDVTFVYDYFYKNS